MTNVQLLFKKVILNFQKFSSWCLKEERNWHFRDQNLNFAAVCDDQNEWVELQVQIN
mgnify:FL=1